MHGLRKMAPSQALPIIKGPREGIDKVDAAAISSSLETHLTSLQNAENEQSILKLLTDDTLNMVSDVLSILPKLNLYDGIEQIICKVTDIFMIANDAGKEAKKCIVSTVTEKCIDLIISQSFWLMHKIEILKSINAVLENCPVATKQELLPKAEIINKLSLMCSCIYDIGDYELQVCIIEFLFRLIPKSMRADYTRNMINNYTVYTEFLNIRDSKFETDCRYFLNKINEQSFNVSTRVYSFPAEFVKIDGEKIYKPSDEGYNEFWVDFNTGSKRIGIFCEPNFLSSQQSQEEELWETISVRAQDVKRYTCTVQNKLVRTDIEILPGSQLLGNKSDGQCHLVVIAVSQNFNLEKALEETLKPNKKTSSVANPICVVLKGSLNPSRTVETKESNANSCHKEVKKVTLNSKFKTSVPSEPMTTPASSVITSEVDEAFSWNQMQQNISAANLKNPSSHKLQKTEETLKYDEALANVVAIKLKVDCNDAGKQSFDLPSKTVDSNRRFNIEKSSDLNSNTVKTQAKVRASEKCTDMREHNLDARASDACVDVALTISPLKEGGDNNLSSQNFLKDKMLQPSDETKLNCKKKSNGKINKKGNSIPENKHEKSEDLKKRKVMNSSNPRVRSIRGTGKTVGEQVPTTPTKTLRSGKKIKTPIVFIQDLQKISDKDPGNIPASLKNNQDPYSKHIKVQKQIKGKMKQRKAEKKQKKNTLESHLTVGDLINIQKKTKSPGNVSLEDFKLSKSFIAMENQKKIKDPRRTKSSTVKSKSQKNKSDVYENALLKDIIPRFQEKVQIKKQDTNEAILKPHSEESRISVDTSSSNSESHFPDIKKTQSISTSTSVSGELYIETAAKKVGSDIDIIAETQCDNMFSNIKDMSLLNVSNNDKHSQQKLMSPKPYDNFDTKEQHSHNANANKKFENVLKRKSNPIRKVIATNSPLNASGDFHKPILELPLSSNVESSFVFCNTKTKKAANFLNNADKTGGAGSSVDVKKRKRSSNLLLDKGKSKLNIESEIISVQLPEKKSNSQSQPRKGLAGIENNSDLEKNHRKTDSQSTNEISKPSRNLRPRNKVVSYKECASLDSSLSTKLQEKTDIATKLTNYNTPDSACSSSLKSTPLNEKSNDYEKDKNCFKQLGYLAPKKLLKSKETRQKIWTTQHVEKTVTTTAYAKLVHNSSTLDPYDFDLECKTLSRTTTPTVPLRGSYGKHNLEAQSISISCIKQNKKEPAFKSVVKSQYTECIGKEKNIKNFDKKESYCKKENIFNLKQSSKNSMVIGKSKEQSTYDWSSTKPLNSINDSDNSISNSSSKFQLFASQRDTCKESSGLVFPHLDDSIPCTPYDFNTNEDVEQFEATSDRKSFGSEISWLSRARTASIKTLEDDKKTYDKHKTCQIEHKNIFKRTDKDADALCLYTPIQQKQKSGEINNPRSKSLVSTVDQSIKTNMIKTDKNNLSSSYSLTKQVVKGTKPKRNSLESKEAEISCISLSNKSSIIDSPSCGNYSDKTDGSDTDVKTKNRVNKKMMKSWSEFSSKMDHQLEEAMKSISGSIDHFEYSPNVFSGICSGPATAKRPTQSELKRKYSNISSTSSEEVTSQDTSVNMTAPNKILKKDSILSSSLVRQDNKQNRKVTPFTPKTPNIKDDSLQYLKKLSNPHKNVRKKSKFKDSEGEPPKKKRKSQRKLDLSTPAACHKHTGKDSLQKSKSNLGLSGAPKSFEFELNSDTESPVQSLSVVSKKCINSSLGLDLSPLKPITLSSNGSSLITKSVLDSPLVSDVDDNDTSACLTAFNNIAKDVLKTNVDQVSESSSELSGQLLEENAGLGNLRHYILKQKSVGTGPSFDGGLKDIMKSAHHVINTSWEENEIKRINAVKKFQDSVQKVIFHMSKDLKELTETELKTTVIWAQQMEKFKKFRESHQKEFRRLKSSHEILNKELQQTHTESQNMQKTIKISLKRDVDALQKKLLSKISDQSLEAMRRCLQASIMF